MIKKNKYRATTNADFTHNSSKKMGQQEFYYLEFASTCLYFFFTELEKNNEYIKKHAILPRAMVHPVIKIFFITKHLIWAVRESLLQKKEPQLI